MSSAKVAPADPAHLYAGGFDIRKTIKYTHMREASKKGCFEWFVLRLPAPLVVANKPLTMH